MKHMEEHKQHEQQNQHNQRQSTTINNNESCGMIAGKHGKVNIHLPFQHNTSHGNVNEDRHQHGGGSIANMNADGSFTHVAVEEGEDDY